MNCRYIVLIFASIILLTFTICQNTNSKNEDPHANCNMSKDKKISLSKKNVFWRESLKQKHKKHHKINETAQNETDVIATLPVESEDVTPEQIPMGESIELRRNHNYHENNESHEEEGHHHHVQKENIDANIEILAKLPESERRKKHKRDIEEQNENLRRTHNHTKHDGNDDENVNEKVVIPEENLRRTHNHTENHDDDDNDNEDEKVDIQEENLRRTHHRDHHENHHENQKENVNDTFVDETPQDESSNSSEESLRRRHHHKNNHHNEENANVTVIDEITTEENVTGEGQGENLRRIHNHKDHHHTHQNEDVNNTDSSSIEHETPKSENLRKRGHHHKYEDADNSTEIEESTSTTDGVENLRRKHSHNHHNNHKNQTDVTDHDNEDSVNKNDDQEAEKSVDNKRKDNLNKRNHHENRRHHENKEPHQSNTNESVVPEVVNSSESVDTQTDSQTSFRSHNQTRNKNSTSKNHKNKQDKQDLVDAVAHEDEHNSESDLNLIQVNENVKISKNINMLQLKCLDNCVEKCKTDYKDNLLEINNCAVKACKCQSGDLTFNITKERTWTGMIIDSLIVISVISLITSIFMIGITLYRKRENFPTDKYENGYDSINLDFSREINEDKLIDARIFEPNYELMTTEIDEGDYKEISIRDF